MVEWRFPEERKRLTKKQWLELWTKQDGRCVACGQRMVVKGANEVELLAPRDEHLEPLWCAGSNEMANRELWCALCSKVKTAEEAPVRAKSNRIRAKHIGMPKKSSWRSKPEGYKFCWKTRKYVKE